MPFDFASSQEIAALDAKLSQVLALLARTATPTVEPLVTLEQAASHVKFDKRIFRYHEHKLRALGPGALHRYYAQVATPTAPTTTRISFTPYAPTT